MTTLSHEPSKVVPERSRLAPQILVPELWASLAIAVMWLTVLFDAIFGPDIVATSGAAGAGTTTTVPSAVVVTFFAFLATWILARHAFGSRRGE
jgi:hypothetical protein